LPIYLIISGKIKSAVACDINQQPLRRGEDNINKYGLADKISTVCTNGLVGLGQFNPTDILICGMGGDLIAEILHNCDDCNIKRGEVRLVLQPMTHMYELRKYLLSNGFDIVEETTIYDDKFYQIIVAQFNDEGNLNNDYSEAELLLGKINILKSTEEFLQYVSYLQKIWSLRREGKKKALLDYQYDEYMLKEFDMILKGRKL
jgi:tRNA A22 N-methylase